MKECIDRCRECSLVCMETLQFCIERGGKHVEPSHLRILMDCAQICETSARFMISRSAFHQTTCGLCADVCESCQDSCDSFGDDPLMNRCSDACRQCAESCREMSGGGRISAAA